MPILGLGVFMINWWVRDEMRRNYVPILGLGVLCSALAPQLTSHRTLRRRLGSQSRAPISTVSSPRRLRTSCCLRQSCLRAGRSPVRHRPAVAAPVLVTGGSRVVERRPVPLIAQVPCRPCQLTIPRLRPAAASAPRPP